MNIIALHYQLIMTLTYTFRHCTLISSQHSMGMTDLQTFKLVPMNCLAILPCLQSSHLVVPFYLPMY